MSLRFVHLKSDGIAPYVEGLRALERDIEYPIADGADAFRIDHGAEYHPFFSDLGDANFILGVGKAEKRVIFLVDIGRVLSSEEAEELAVAAA